ncbi:EAL domain-containing protein [Acinetobacter baumannii]
MNLRIVAEGVETAEQQAFLTRLGCDSLQGYLLGRPMAAESLSATTLPSP